MHCGDEKIIFLTRNPGKMWDKRSRDIISSPSHHCTTVSKSHSYFRSIPFTTLSMHLLFMFLVWFFFLFFNSLFM